MQLITIGENPLWLGQFKIILIDFSDCLVLSLQIVDLISIRRDESKHVRLLDEL